MNTSLQFYPSQKHRYSSKAIIVGNSSVGKTSLLDRFTSDRFNPHMSRPSVGLNYMQVFCRAGEHIMKLDFWDTAGSERYRTITPSFYRKSAGIIFVFDITNRKSFEDIEKWMNEAFSTIEDEVVKILVGNKSDEIFSREVDFCEGEEFARKHGMEYIEASAMTGDNVQQIFERTSELIVTKFNGEGARDYEYLKDNRKGRITIRPEHPNKLGGTRSCRC